LVLKIFELAIYNAKVSGPVEWSDFCGKRREATPQKLRNVTGSTAPLGYNLLG